MQPSGYRGAAFFRPKNLLYQIINAAFFNIRILKDIFELITLILRPLCDYSNYFWQVHFY